jgi:hypothetical protein
MAKIIQQTQAIRLGQPLHHLLNQLAGREPAFLIEVKVVLLHKYWFYVLVA